MKASKDLKSVIELLADKNHHLEKFYSLNDSQIEAFVAGQYEGLEVFYRTREGLLDVIRKIDDMIEVSNDIPLEGAAVDAVLKQKIVAFLQKKNSLVAKILEQDLQIISAIESAKSKVIKELAQVRGAKKAIGAYKSGTSNSSLDEEA